MKMKEAHRVMRMLKAGYPKFYRKCSAEEMEDSIMLIASSFKDENTEDVIAAIRELIKLDTDGFPPSIGEINEIMNLRTRF